jgi:hypothetical protein
MVAQMTTVALSKQPSIHSGSSPASDDNSTGKKTSSSPRKDKSSRSGQSSNTTYGSESLLLLPDLELAFVSTLKFWISKCLF